MKKLIIAAVTLTALTGCMSTYEAPSTTKLNKYSAVNERVEHRPGSVSYLLDGADFVVAGRRENAYKFMFKTCDEKFVILEKDVAKGNPSSMTTYNQFTKSYTTSNSSGYTYAVIYFECLSYLEELKKKQNGGR